MIGSDEKRGVRKPLIGARFRRMQIEPLSGTALGYAEYTVIAVHPSSFIAPYGRVELASDCSGRSVFADLDHFWGTTWEATGNVIVLHP